MFKNIWSGRRFLPFRSTRDRRQFPCQVEWNLMRIASPSHFPNPSNLASKQRSSERSSSSGNSTSGRDFDLITQYPWTCADCALIIAAHQISFYRYKCTSCRPCIFVTFISSHFLFILLHAFTSLRPEVVFCFTFLIPYRHRLSWLDSILFLRLTLGSWFTCGFNHALSLKQRNLRFGYLPLFISFYQTATSIT